MSAGAGDDDARTGGREEQGEPRRCPARGPRARPARPPAPPSPRAARPRAAGAGGAGGRAGGGGERGRRTRARAATYGPRARARARPRPLPAQRTHLDRVRGLDVQRDRLAREGLHEDLREGEREAGVSVRVRQRAERTADTTRTRSRAARPKLARSRDTAKSAAKARTYLHSVACGEFVVAFLSRPACTAPPLPRPSCLNSTSAGRRPCQTTMCPCVRRVERRPRAPADALARPPAPQTGTVGWKAPVAAAVKPAGPSFLAAAAAA